MTDRKPAIDLKRHHKVFHIQDMSLYMSWLYNEDQEDEEPCMVLIPRYRTRGFKPCVIALSAAFQYNDPRYLARVTPFIATELGFENNLANAHKIASLIYDHLDDLVKMPPSPTTNIIVGEASFLLHGKKRHVDIIDYEPTPQA